MGLVAGEAAYRYGEEWYSAVIKYLEGNIAWLRNYLKVELPEIHMIEPEGTYLIWLDFRDLHMSETEREQLIVQKAGIWLDSGVMFGGEGEGFERINVACPRRTLEVAMEKLRSAISTIKET